jgi:esterase/lipase
MRLGLVALVLAALAAPASISVASAPRSLEKTVVKPLRLREQCLRRAERSHVVRFRAADGTRLLGVVFGRGRSGVVLSHGLRGDLCSWTAEARKLAARGYRVLAFDSRGHGSSATRTGAARWRVDLDAAAAARELRRRGVASVVLAGSSMGGIAVLVAAADLTPPVSGVVSLSGPRSFVLLDAEKAVRRMQVPVLFAAAEFDDPFQVDARALYEAAASSEKRLEILPGSGDHGTRLLRNAPPRAAFNAFLAAHSTAPA